MTETDRSNIYEAESGESPTQPLLRKLFGNGTGGFFNAILTGLAITLGGSFAGWLDGLKAGFFHFFLMLALSIPAYSFLGASIAELVRKFPVEGGSYGIVRLALSPAMGYMNGVCDVSGSVLFVAALVFYMSAIFTEALELPRATQPAFWAVFYSAIILRQIVSGSSVWTVNIGMYIVCIAALCIASLLAAVVVGDAHQMDFAKYAVGEGDKELHESDSSSLSFTSTASDTSERGNMFNPGIQVFLRHFPSASWFFVGIAALPALSHFTSQPKINLPSAIQWVVGITSACSLIALFAVASLSPGTESYSAHPQMLPDSAVSSAFSSAVSSYFRLQSSSSSSRSIHEALFHGHGRVSFVLPWTAGLTALLDNVPAKHAALLNLPALFELASGLMFAHSRQICGMSLSVLLPEFLLYSVGQDVVPYLALLTSAAFGLAISLCLWYSLTPEDHSDRRRVPDYLFNVGLLLQILSYLCVQWSFLRLEKDMFRSDTDRNVLECMRRCGAYYSMIVFMILAIALVGFQNDHQFALYCVLIWLVAALLYYYWVAKHKQVFSEEEKEVLFIGYVSKANREGAVRRRRSQSFASPRNRTPTSASLGGTAGMSRVGSSSYRIDLAMSGMMSSISSKRHSFSFGRVVNLAGGTIAGGGGGSTPHSKIRRAINLGQPRGGGTNNNSNNNSGNLGNSSAYSLVNTAVSNTASASASASANNTVARSFRTIDATGGRLANSGSGSGGESGVGLCVGAGGGGRSGHTLGEHRVSFALDLEDTPKSGLSGSSIPEGKRFFGLRSSRSSGSGSGSGADVVVGEYSPSGVSVAAAASKEEEGATAAACTDVSNAVARKLHAQVSALNNAEGAAEEEALPGVLKAKATVAVGNIVAVVGVTTTAPPSPHSPSGIAEGGAIELHEYLQQQNAHDRQQTMQQHPHEQLDPSFDLPLLFQQYHTVSTIEEESQAVLTSTNSTAAAALEGGDTTREDVALVTVSSSLGAVSDASIKRSTSIAVSAATESELTFNGRDGIADISSYTDCGIEQSRDGVTSLPVACIAPQKESLLEGSSDDSVPRGADASPSAATTTAVAGTYQSDGKSMSSESVTAAGVSAKVAVSSGMSIGSSRCSQELLPPIRDDIGSGRMRGSSIDDGGASVLSTIPLLETDPAKYAATDQQYEPKERQGETGEGKHNERPGRLPSTGVSESYSDDPYVLESCSSTDEGLRGRNISTTTTTVAAAVGRCKAGSEEHTTDIVAPPATSTAAFKAPMAATTTAATMIVEKQGERKDETIFLASGKPGTALFLPSPAAVFLTLSPTTEEHAVDGTFTAFSAGHIGDQAVEGKGVHELPRNASEDSQQSAIVLPHNSSSGDSETERAIATAAAAVSAAYIHSRGGLHSGFVPVSGSGSDTGTNISNTGVGKIKINQGIGSGSVGIGHSESSSGAPGGGGVNAAGDQENKNKTGGDCNAESRVGTENNDNSDRNKKKKQRTRLSFNLFQLSMHPDAAEPDAGSAGYTANAGCGGSVDGRLHGGKGSSRNSFGSRRGGSGGGSSGGNRYTPVGQEGVDGDDDGQRSVHTISTFRSMRSSLNRSVRKSSSKDKTKPVDYYNAAGMHLPPLRSTVGDSGYGGSGGGGDSAAGAAAGQHGAPGDNRSVRNAFGFIHGMDAVGGGDEGADCDLNSTSRRLPHYGSSSNASVSSVGRSQRRRAQRRRDQFRLARAGAGSMENNDPDRHVDIENGGGVGGVSGAAGIGADKAGEPEGIAEGEAGGREIARSVSGMAGNATFSGSGSDRLRSIQRGEARERIKGLEEVGGVQECDMIDGYSGIDGYLHPVDLENAVKRSSSGGGGGMSLYSISRSAIALITGAEAGTAGAGSRTGGGGWRVDPRKVAVYEGSLNGSGSARDDRDGDREAGCGEEDGNRRSRYDEESGVSVEEKSESQHGAGGGSSGGGSGGASTQVGGEGSTAAAGSGRVGANEKSATAASRTTGSSAPAAASGDNDHNSYDERVFSSTSSRHRFKGIRNRRRGSASSSSFYGLARAGTGAGSVAGSVAGSMAGAAVAGAGAGVSLVGNLVASALSLMHLPNPLETDDDFAMYTAQEVCDFLNEQERRDREYVETVVRTDPELSESDGGALTEVYDPYANNPEDGFLVARHLATLAAEQKEVNQRRSRNSSPTAQSGHGGSNNGSPTAAAAAAAAGAGAAVALSGVRNAITGRGGTTAGGGGATAASVSGSLHCSLEGSGHTARSSSGGFLANANSFSGAGTGVSAAGAMPAPIVLGPVPVFSTPFLPASSSSTSGVSGGRGFVGLSGSRAAVQQQLPADTAPMAIAAAAAAGGGAGAGAGARMSSTIGVSADSSRLYPSLDQVRGSTGLRTHTSEAWGESGGEGEGRSGVGGVVGQSDAGRSTVSGATEEERNKTNYILQGSSKAPTASERERERGSATVAGGADRQASLSRLKIRVDVSQGRDLAPAGSHPPPTHQTYFSAELAVAHADADGGAMGNAAIGGTGFSRIRTISNGSSRGSSNSGTATGAGAQERERVQQERVVTEGDDNPFTPNAAMLGNVRRLASTGTGTGMGAGDAVGVGMQRSHRREQRRSFSGLPSSSPASSDKQQVQQRQQHLQQPLVRSIEGERRASGGSENNGGDDDDSDKDDEERAIRKPVRKKNSHRSQLNPTASASTASSTAVADAAAAQPQEKDAKSFFQWGRRSFERSSDRARDPLPQTHIFSAQSPAGLGLGI